LRSVLQTVPDAMIIIDERGRIESLSTTAERLFGYSMAEAAGRNVSLFMPSPDREQHDSYLKRYLSTGEKRIIGIGRIVVGQRKDGTTFPMHLTVGELRSAERHYFTGFIRDLTAQQLTETRLKELQSEVTHMSRYTALGEMASTLAHEINQPLTAISNYLRGSQRLLDRLEAEPTPMLREALGKAADQALRAGHIIRRLREFVARGEGDRRIEDLPKLIEDASTLALVGVREAGITVSFHLDPKAQLVLADRIQIQQVLVNLIRNAMEIMVETANERRLEIATVALPGDVVEVSVADTGAGLAPEVARNLFQPFVTTKRQGMGLGLSICRTIVEAHGGKIRVDSRPGGGTIFRFTLRAAAFEETVDAGRRGSCHRRRCRCPPFARVPADGVGLCRACARVRRRLPGGDAGGGQRLRRHRHPHAADERARTATPAGRAEGRPAGDRHDGPRRRAAGGRGDEGGRRRFHREAVRRRDPPVRHPRGPGATGARECP
jgi:two-component system sensor kinase FixL